MLRISRRFVIKTLGGISLSALTPFSKFGQSRASAPSSGTQPSLYLIFTGAWVFFSQNNRLMATTSHFTEHKYDFGITKSMRRRKALKKGITYTVEVPGADNSGGSFEDLLKPLSASGEALILKRSCCAPQIPPGARTLSLPIPSSVSTGALLCPVTINIDQSYLQVPPKTLPTALILEYSGAWQRATITGSDSNVPSLNISAGDLNYPHISFRTCVAAECNLPSSCKIDCNKIKHSVDHANKVFTSFLQFLQVANIPTQPVAFEPCTQGIWPLKVEHGSNANVEDYEIGIDHPICFANLHNCASGTMIVGS